MENIYLPHLAIIENIKDETADIKTFQFKFQDKEIEKNFKYQPGQFVELSVLGEGEAPFCLSNSPTRSSIDCSIKRLGKVTQALHQLSVGDTVGLRGPYGRAFPMDELKGKNVVFIAGGIGLAPLRSAINYCLDKRADFEKITIINGARTAKDLVYQDEYEKWGKAKNVDLRLTIDKEEKGWQHDIGVVPKILEKAKPSAKDAKAIVCGPPIMIKFTLPSLFKLGFAEESIITTLEMKMKCGLGKCGRCNIGHLYICQDGPVFTFAEIKNLAGC